VRLRLQLILVSLLALCLPWAGCSYIRDMETALRQGQQQALLATARAVALTINNRDHQLQELVIPPSEGLGATLFLHPTAQHAVADGYPDEWRDQRADYRHFTTGSQSGEPLRVEFLAASDGTTCWLFFNVADKTVRYHNPSRSGIANGDHLRLALVTPQGTLRHYWLAPEAPGELNAKTYRSNRIVMEPRIHGAWRDTGSGYQLEIALPAELLGNRLGFTVMDAGNERHWAGSMPPQGQPGRLIHPSAALADTLGLFARGNLRLSVVDATHWLRARRGELQDLPDDRPPPPAGAWLLESLYRWIMDDPGIPTGFATPIQGRLIRPEIDAALEGAGQTRWYRRDSGARNGSAIVTASWPIHREAAIVGAIVAEQGSGEMLSLTNTAMTRLLLITLTATLTIGFGLLAYASWLSYRIGRLSRHVGAVMAPDGRLSTTFPQHWAGDEIGDLGRHFSQLLNRIREYTEYLRMLSSRLSHELRTPLAVVRSSLDNLEDVPLPSDTASYLERAREGSARLGRILEAMSAATRVEESIAATGKSPVRLDEFLSGMVEGYRAAYPDRVIEARLTSVPLVIDGSADLLAQMLDKLMDNAADFCSDTGTIRLALDRRADNAVISLSNDGPLLPESMHAQLFDSMVSIRGGKGDTPHLGLGLAIVGLVVDFHGGTVRAENREDGSGVRFVITLPLARDR